MTGWTTHQGTAVLIDQDNLDTDQLIPARFMSTPRSEGYGQYLLYAHRYDRTGAPRSGYPLNRYPNASILIAGRNFGSGSSREAAVYALVDFGIQAVLAPSFGDIFASNAVNNGLLPARISAETLEALRHAIADDMAQADVDLLSREIRVGGTSISFDLNPVWREKLINGWDDIDLTTQHAGAISAFRMTRHKTQNWTFPSDGNV